MGLLDTFRKATLPKRDVSSVVSANLDRSAAVFSTPATLESAVWDKQLLFVGLEPQQIQTLRADFARLQPKWDCRFVSDAAQAIEQLPSGSFRIVVSNRSCAGDPALIAALQKQSGATLRLVLCESNDRADLAGWEAAGAVPVAHDTDAAGLIGTIKRVTRLREWTADAGMQKLLAQCRKLPVMPTLYAQVTAELNSPNGSIDMVAHYIAQDPLMTAKVLQVVNSAVFALDREVSDPADAVMFLGLGRIQSLILLAGTFSQFENGGVPGFSPDSIWNHSLRVATLAQIIALEETEKPKIAEAAFTSGLMHDMGKLILAANVPAMCSAIGQLHQGKELTQREAELQVLGTTHAELAACLLGTWGLPLSVLEAVAWHHCPTRSSDGAFTPLTAVHAANILVHEMDGESETAGTPESFDHGYLLQIGLGECRNKWRETCGLAPRPDEDAEYKRVRLRRDAKRN